MKTFILTASATFDAESIDDAFAKLAEHFRALAAGEDRPTIFLPGSEITVEREA